MHSFSLIFQYFEVQSQKRCSENSKSRRSW